MNPFDVGDSSKPPLPPKYHALMSSLRMEYDEAKAVLDRRIQVIVECCAGNQLSEEPLRDLHREDLRALTRRFKAKRYAIMAAAAAERAAEQASAQVVGGSTPADVDKVVEEGALGPVVPDEVDKVAEEGALGHVVGGGVPNAIVPSPVVVEPVADSPTAPAISAEEVAPAQTSPSPMPSCSPPLPPLPTLSVGTVSTSAASLLRGSTPDVLNKVAEGTALGQVDGGSPPDKVAEGKALGQVAGGGVPDTEDKVGGIVPRLVVEDPVAHSSTASTIPADEVEPGGPPSGGGNTLGGRQLPALLQGKREGPGFGRGIPWLDKRGRVTAWLSPRLERVVPYEPHLLSPRESECAPTDFRGGKDPG